MITDRFKAVIFDMDGTLVDNMDYHQEAWLRFLKSYGIYISVEEFKKKNYGIIDEIVPRFFPEKPDKEIIHRLGQEKEELYREIYGSHIKPIDGLLPFLKKLKEHQIKIGLATAADKKNIDFTLEGLGVTDFFTTVTGAEEVKKGKPDPEVFLVTAKKLGVSPQQCLVIEDSMTGIQAGLAAGMQVIAITTEHTKDELKKFPLYKTIDNYSDL
jgi:beta-phosphoglucomutase